MHLLHFPSYARQSSCLFRWKRLTSMGWKPQFYSTDGNPSQNQKESVKRMRQLFQRGKDPCSPTLEIDAWEMLWREGLTPWDLGGPTKVLLSELEQLQKHEQFHGTEWRSALIPGCGRGYDVVALARYWDQPAGTIVPTIHRTVYGLEISETSLHRAKESVATSIREHGDFENTHIQLYHGDFFDDPSTWSLYFEQTIPRDNTLNAAASPETLASNRTFDFIFDYTFFCAIPPSQRKHWGERMSHLLSKRTSGDKGCGGLLTLMFPYVEEARTESSGPPYVVSYEDYVDALQDGIEVENHKFTLRLTTTSPYKSEATVTSRVGQEMIGWWSFEIDTSWRG